MRWNDIPQLSQSRAICKGVNLEDALNNFEMLEKIYNDTCKEIGLNSSQTIANDLFINKLGEVILRYAQNGKIDPNKTLALINSQHGADTHFILGCTAVCLMEKYGIIRGGPKIP
jgi:hypothetical protein